MTENEYAQKVTTFEHLNRRRTVMERECHNPESWRELSEQYQVIGAKANAAKCAKLAKHFEAIAK